GPRPAAAPGTWLAEVVRAQRAVADAGLDVEAVLRTAVAEVGALTHAPGAAVEVLDGDVQVTAAAAGTLSPFAGRRRPRGTGLTGAVLESGEPLVCDDVDTDPRADAGVRASGVRASVIVPLTLWGERLGVLSGVSDAPGAFGEADLHALQLLAANVAAALSAARRYAALAAAYQAQEEVREALMLNEWKYRSVFESAASGLFLAEPEGEGGFVYTEMNAALAAILGIGRGDFLGHAPREVFPRGLAERVSALYREVCETGTTLEIEHTNRLPRGEVTTRTRLQPVPGRGGGRFTRVLGVVEDVTERRRDRARLEAYARELERSNRELQSFAYVASHDLQEPLRKVRAFGDRLQARFAAALGAEGADYVARMQGAAERMSTLIADLLAFSRVTSTPVVFAPVDLERVVAEVVSDLQARLEETGGRVEVAPIPTLRADATQMRQLFQNLLGNALKFHRPGVPPVVRVTAEEAVGPRGAPAVRLGVADNGIGFEPRHAERIFGPFQRLHGRGEYEGTGMGLAIVRRIAERHGGAVEASGVPGEGAAFAVVLPLEPPAHPGDPEPRP
ncbi:MAG TPA: ATP-binding protein, partial [Longimicrobium sp.]|nr:ATP-binding protein [Longimicrobium sp.]